MAYEVMPRVFFGPSGVTFRPEDIAPFTHIINCSDCRAYTNMWAIDGRGFLYLESQDVDDFPILERHFAQFVEFIDAAVEDPDASVYIHCLMGLNRSACLAVAYACLRGGRGLHELVTELRGREGHTLTNPGFCQQLMDRFPLAPAEAQQGPKSE